MKFEIDDTYSAFKMAEILELALRNYDTEDYDSSETHIKRGSQ